MASDLGIWSSDQWFTVMDRMLGIAFADLIDRTTVAEYCVSRLVVYQHSNKRRGLSMRMGRKTGDWEWENVVSAMLAFIADPTPERFAELRLDRAYAQEMLIEFLSLTAGYADAVARSAVDDAWRLGAGAEKIGRVHRAAGLKHGRDMVQTVANVAYLSGQVTSFRNRIIQEYSEYIDRMAAYDAAHHQLRVSAADTRQLYYLAAMKAINHYNQDRGSFKSYMDIWIKKARNTGGHVTGSAYIPPSGAKANHISVNMDDVQEPSTEDGDSMQPDLVHKVASLVDSDGYLAQAMGLDTDEALSERIAD